MKLNVTGRKIEVTDGIRDHLKDKINKTIIILDKTADIHITLSVEKHRHLAEIILKTKGMTLHSHEETKDMYISIDKALEKMENQLRKHRDKAKEARSKQDP
ncbi:MAG: ribosome-associated translation inhibitor RaiA [Nitrospinota bacterium]|nr:ribosome-associated translation inhibitor RaiA [Nitrospinota bacterium]